MTAFRLSLLLLWAVVAAVTSWAVATLGLAAAAATFFGDLGHPWRAQFYADLEAQLLVFAGWILWRERLSASGWAGAAATLLLGALFTLPYLLAASIRSRGDVRRLLLGSRADGRGSATR